MRLREARHLLGEVLGEGLRVAVAPYGGNVNPPCVLTRPAVDYLEVTGYCSDIVRLEAIVLPGGGEGEATADVLDDLIDEIRGVLLVPLDGGFKFSFRSVSLLSDEDQFGAVASITYERNDD